MKKAFVKSHTMLNESELSRLTNKEVVRRLEGSENRNRELPQTPTLTSATLRIFKP